MMNMRSQNMQMSKQFPEQPHQPLHPTHPMMGNLVVPPMMNKDMQHQPQPGRPVPGRPPSSVGGPQTQTQSLPNMGQGARSSVALQPPPTKNKKQPISTPSPAAIPSVSTPVANALTPTLTAASPSAAAKSPKVKANKQKPVTPKEPKRRLSKAVPMGNTTAESSQPSTSGSMSSNPGKRPREEEMTTTQGGLSSGESEVANEGSPPKRAKTEWEAQPTEAMLRKDEEIANIKTEEDVTIFFNQMQELIKAAGSQEDGQQMTTGISRTLDMFLKGYSPGADAMDGLAGGSGSVGELRELTPPPGPLNDTLDEFFDFSFGTVEDEDSKAATPDLVSSANPSPESNHDGDTAHHLLSSASTSTIEVKTEDASDILRLGIWKEIDGGEATYYQMPDSRWDGPMTTVDQPWAIFNS